MAEKSVKIAVIGFGTVGSGVARILLEETDQICQKTGIRLELTDVVDNDLNRPRSVELPDGMLHGDFDKILQNKDLSIVAVLVGGITIAAEIQKKLLTAGKDVVTANKALLAERGDEIYDIARRQGRCVAFEASCCGGIPIISAIQNGLAANQITAMYGIVNGTCNYILSEMTQKQKEYAVALHEAQAAGFAEADPTLDVNGADSAHKLAILSLLAFGKKIDYHKIPTCGIDNLNLADIQYGREMGYIIKLLAISQQTPNGLSLRVGPCFIAKDELLAQVSGAFNCISIFGNAVGHTSYYGPGAGMMPTASAVVADIIDLARGNAARTFNTTCGLAIEPQPAKICPAEEIQSKFYIRLSVADRPGVFAKVGTILADRNISISGLLQHEGDSADCVPVVVMTHRVKKGDMDQALTEIEKLEAVKEKPVCIEVLTPHVDSQQ